MHKVFCTVNEKNVQQNDNLKDLASFIQVWTTFLYSTIYVFVPVTPVFVFLEFGIHSFFQVIHNFVEAGRDWSEIKAIVFK